MIDALMAILHAMDGLGDVQRPAITGGLMMPRFNVEISQRLVKSNFIGRSGHQRLLVQPDPLDVGRAIDHPSKGSVAQGQRFQPFAGRTLIPEPEICWRCRLGFCLQECEAGKKAGFQVSHVNALII